MCSQELDSLVLVDPFQWIWILGISHDPMILDFFQKCFWKEEMVQKSVWLEREVAPVPPA